jgi:hypothetical protein
MSTVSAKRATAIFVMLVVATAALLAVEFTWMSPGEGRVPFALATSLVGVVMAALAGATTLGLVALWSAIRGTSLRHPIAAFGVGVIAFVAVQAYAAVSFQTYKTLPGNDRNEVRSESLNNTR